MIRIVNITYKFLKVFRYTVWGNSVVASTTQPELMKQHPDAESIILESREVRVVTDSLESPRDHLDYYCN